MKRILAAFIACVMFCTICNGFAVFAVSYTEENEEFFDDFSDGMAEWTISSGNSEVVGVSEYMNDKMLFLNGKKFSNTLGVFRTGTWSDIAFQSDFVIPKGGGYYGWYFRYSANDHYLLQFYPTNELKLLKRTSALGTGYTEITSSNVSIEAGNIYTIQIMAKGNNISVFLDYKPIIAVVDDDIKHGTIGVRALSQEVYFDNVFLSSLTDAEYIYGEDKVLFHEHFDDGTVRKRWADINCDIDFEESIYFTQGTNMLKVTGTENNVQTMVAGNFGWTDYILSSDVVVCENTVVGILFRYLDDKNHYLLQYDNGRITLYRRKNSLTYEELGKTDYIMKADYVYRFKIDINADVIKIYIDDTKVLELNDTNLTSGKIGFCVHRDTAILDNIIVYSGREPQILPTKTEKIISPIDISGVKQFYYVSPDGNDDNDGSIDFPFKTMTKAKEKIASVGVPEGGVCVYFREGEYYMPTGEYFYEANKGGRPGSPVVYSSYPGERAVFTGAIRINKEHQISVSKQVAQRLIYPERVIAIDLEACGVDTIDEMVPTGYSFNPGVANYELYYGNEKLTLARWPNNQYLSTGTIIDRGSRPGFGETENNGFSFRYNENRPAYWENTKDIWMSGAWSREWAYSNIKIDKIDVANNTITTVQPSPFGAEEDMPYYYYNILEELDSPGEWYIDRDNKILYVYPPGTLENTYLSLSYNPYAFFRFSSASNMVFQNIDICRTRANGVTINENVSNVVFQGCRISNVGLTGISISGTNCGFLNGEIVNAGGTGITLGCGAANRKELIASGNFCHNSYIESCGKVNYSYLANVFGVENIFTNNVVRDGYAGGISFGGNENVIAHNEVSEVCKLVNDGGGIYTAGRDFTQRGNKIYNNYIHDVNASETNILSSPAGIYLDAMSSGNFISGNTIVRVTHPLLIGGGRENTITGNLIIDKTKHAKTSFTFDQRGTDPTEYEDQGTIWDRLVSVTKNAYDNMPCSGEVWKTKYPKLTVLWDDEPQKPKYNVVSGNFIYNHKNSSIFPQVKEYGRVDDNITLENADSFIAYQNDDFNLKIDAELYQLSDLFKETEFYRIGIYNDGIFRKTKKIVSDFYLTYPVETMSMDEQYFSWSESSGADVYDVEVANDCDFVDLIYKESTINTHIDAPVLESGKAYYWRVTAYSRAKSFSNIKTVSDVSSFRTTTEAELLIRAINDAKEIYNTAINKEVLEFAREDLNAFRALIYEVESLQSSAVTSELINKLKTGLTEFLLSNKNPEISFTDDFATLSLGETPVGYYRADSTVVGDVDSGGEKCIMFNDADTATYPALIKQVENITGRAVVKFSIQPKQTSGVLNIKLRETNGVTYQDPIVMSFKNNLIYVDGNYVTYFIKDNWYHVTIDINLINSTYSLSINNSQKITEKSFSGINYLNQLVFTGDVASVGKYYIDNVAIEGNNGFYKPIYDKYMANNLCDNECVIVKNGAVLNLSDKSVNGKYYSAVYDGEKLSEVFVENITIPPGEKVLPIYNRSEKEKIMFWSKELVPLCAAKTVTYIDINQQ